jgi:hypothetical protein
MGQPLHAAHIALCVSDAMACMESTSPDNSLPRPGTPKAFVAL